MGDDDEGLYASAFGAGALPLPEALSPARGAATSARQRLAAVRRDAASGRWREMLAIAVVAFALALLIGKAAGIARYDATILRYPFQIDDAEGVIDRKSVV